MDNWRRRLSRLDWRIWLGLSLTFGWLLLGYAYVGSTTGWLGFARLPAEQLGSFLEGAFAPLAFLWLVIGYFLQQKELEQNTDALRAQLREVERSAEQAVVQSEKMAASEIHARQETFLSIAQSVRNQLGTIAFFLYMSSQSAARDGTVADDQQGKLFAQLSQNDPEVFSRALLSASLATDTPEESLALFYGTPIRARHSNNFTTTFERLLERAGEVDPDGVIRDAQMSGGHGLLYRVIKRYQLLAPAELGDPNQTGTHIEF
jgi:hypothetical protein